jgi:hypothetical protein
MARLEPVIVLKDIGSKIVKKGIERIANRRPNDPVGSARPQIHGLTLEILQRIDEPLFGP